MTRTDDVINVAGHRISTGRLEEVLNDHPFIAECAVIGREDTLKGHVPVAFVILQEDGCDRTKLSKDIQQVVRERVGAFAKLDRIVFIEKLPKTRSGKILRNLLRDISNNVQQPRVTPTIEDISVIPEIYKAYH